MGVKKYYLGEFLFDFGAVVKRANRLAGVGGGGQNYVRRKIMLAALPDELLQLLLAKLDAASCCRLSQADKTMQPWILLHHKEWIHTWRHARAWLGLCDMAQARVQHRWASIRGRKELVLADERTAGRLAQASHECKQLLPQQCLVQIREAHRLAEKQSPDGSPSSAEARCCPRAL